MTPSCRSNRDALRFQSTLPRKEWRWPTSVNILIWYNFNPHSHAGSDVSKYCRRSSYEISIHTPTQGVTHYRSWYPSYGCNFNPHSHAGSDVDGNTDTTGKETNFNPHSHAGSDTIIGKHTLFAFWFQSTLPRREWHVFKITVHVTFKFQSTLPRREWLCIHASAATLVLYFNPHSHAGSDCMVTYHLKIICVFQSTLPRREWQMPTIIKQQLQPDFNPHSHAGSDFSHLARWYFSLHFNPHSHAGSDQTRLRS